MQSASKTLPPLSTQGPEISSRIEPQKIEEATSGIRKLLVASIEGGVLPEKRHWSTSTSEFELSIAEPSPPVSPTKSHSVTEISELGRPLNWIPLDMVSKEHPWIITSRPFTPVSNTSSPVETNSVSMTSIVEEVDPVLPR